MSAEDHSASAADWLLRDATDIAGAVREGRVSATAIAHACLERISRTEPRVNATTDVTACRALDTAAALDARLAVGDMTARALPLSELRRGKLSHCLTNALREPASPKPRAQRAIGGGGPM